MSFRTMYIGAELRHRPRAVIRQLLFFFPAIALMSFVVFMIGLYYVQQLCYLVDVPYQAVESVRADTQGAFARTTANAYVSHKEGTVEIQDHNNGVELYAPLSDDIDYEHGVFWSGKVEEGKTADELDPGEMLVSRNVADRLQLAVGDEVHIEFDYMGEDDEDESLVQTYTLAGILQAKYRYNNVCLGGDGLALVAPKKLAEFKRGAGDELSYVAFSQDANAGEVLVTKRAELRDAVNLEGVGAVGVVALLGMVLLVVVLWREVSHVTTVRQRSFAILCALGLSPKRFAACIRLEELVLLAASTALAFAALWAVYVQVLHWGFFSLSATLVIFVVYVLIELVLVCMCVRMARKRIEQSNLTDLLRKRSAR